MIEMSWYEYDGKRKPLPKDLVYRKATGGFDLRFKVNKEFLADKRWRYRNPLAEIMAPKIAEYLTAPSIFERMKKGGSIKFKRYSKLKN